MQRPLAYTLFFLTLIALGCKKQDDSIVILNDSYFIGQWNFRTAHQVPVSGDALARVFEFAPDKKLMFNVIVDGVRQTIGWEFEEKRNVLRLLQRDSQDFEVVKFSKNEFTAYD